MLYATDITEIAHQANKENHSHQGHLAIMNKTVIKAATRP
jgi:hypothetical protein